MTTQNEPVVGNNNDNILIIMQDETGCETTIDGRTLSTNSMMSGQTIQQYQGTVIDSSATSATVSKPMEVVVENIAGNDVHQPSDFVDTNTNTYASACLVCGDRASGYHYSVFSCEGCKGFFKRTVQKNLMYCCKEGNNCEINKFTRNSCQACRFSKCIQTGMKIEAVREDRAPGGKHRMKRQRVEETTVLADKGMLSVQHMPQAELRDPVVDNLVNAAPDVFPKYEGGMPVSSLSVNEVMQCGYTELKYIIAWAKKVEDFRSLCMEDQMALLKSSFMELNVLRLAYRSMGLDNTIRFADGLLVSAEMAQSMGWGKELINATLKYASRLKEVHLDHTEYCILNAIVLSFPDASGIQDKEVIIDLQTKFLEALIDYIRHHYPDDTRRYSKILLSLTLLRIVSVKAAEWFLSLTLDGSIQLNDLVLEMIN